MIQPQTQIQYTRIVKSYLQKEPIFKGGNLTIAAGEFLYLTGASGAGKTTLFRLLMGLEEPEEGEVLFEGKPISQLKEKERPAHLRKFGVVFQDYKLLEHKTSRDNIAIPLLIKGMNLNDIQWKVDALAERLGFQSLLEQKVSSLSGGEQQLIAIARAYVHEPAVILADEPTANLDLSTAEHTLDILRKINQGGTTVILATHNLDLIKRHPARTLLIRDAKILEVNR